MKSPTTDPHSELLRKLETAISFNRLQFTLPFGWKPTALFVLVPKGKAELFTTLGPWECSETVVGWSTLGGAIASAARIVSEGTVAPSAMPAAVVRLGVAYQMTHQIEQPRHIEHGTLWWSRGWITGEVVMEASLPESWAKAVPKPLHGAERALLTELGPMIGQWFMVSGRPFDIKNESGEVVTAAVPLPRRLRLVDVNIEGGALDFFDERGEHVEKHVSEVELEVVLDVAADPAPSKSDIPVVGFPVVANSGTEPRIEFAVHWLDVFGDSQSIEHFTDKEAAIASITENSFTEQLLAAVVEKMDHQEETAEIVYVKGDHESLVAGGWIDADLEA
jgi:hypothetical protein